MVLFQWLSVFGFLLHYGTYSKDGRGMPQLEHFSEVRLRPAVLPSSLFSLAPPRPTRSDPPRPALTAHCLT